MIITLLYFAWPNWQCLAQMARPNQDYHILLMWESWASSFVLSVTMGKEAHDDYKRNLRVWEANSQHYLILKHYTSHSTPEDAYLNTLANTRSVPSSSLRVDDLVLLEKNQRVPAESVPIKFGTHADVIYCLAWKVRFPTVEIIYIRKEFCCTVCLLYTFFALLPIMTKYNLTPSMSKSSKAKFVLRSFDKH